MSKVMFNITRAEKLGAFSSSRVLDASEHA